MNNCKTIGVDLAKSVIQVSVVSPTNKELQNKELIRKKFAEFLIKQKPALVAFEACATAHYWSRVARRYGHQTKILPALAVAPLKISALIKPDPLCGPLRPSTQIGVKVRIHCGLGDSVST